MKKGLVDLLIRKTMHLFFTLILFVCFNPGMASALGVGELYGYSFLNELFDAEIELIGAQDHDLSEIQVALAPKEDFIRAGFAYKLPAHIDFKVIRKLGKTFVRATTQQVISEPYLDFVIRLSWGHGVLVRGYTVLLDPRPLHPSKQRPKRWLDLPNYFPKTSPSTLSSKTSRGGEEVIIANAQLPSAPPISKSAAPVNFEALASAAVTAQEAAKSVPATPLPQPLPVSERPGQVAVKKLNLGSEFNDLFDEKMIPARIEPSTPLDTKPAEEAAPVPKMKIIAQVPSIPVNPVGMQQFVPKNKDELQVMMNQIEDKTRALNTAYSALKAQGLSTVESMEELLQLPQKLRGGPWTFILFLPTGLLLAFYARRIWSKYAAKKQQGLKAVPLQWGAPDNVPRVFASGKPGPESQPQALLYKEMASKLDLAHSYVVAEQFAEARILLEDVSQHGDPLAQENAKAILAELPNN